MPNKIRIERYGSLVRGTWEAEPGHVWASRGVHEMVSEARGGRDATECVKRDLHTDAAMGQYRCEEPECDWCHPEEEA